MQIVTENKEWRAVRSQAVSLNIHQELQHLLPALSESEYTGLEADILKDGVLSPLVVWNGIIVDGHHRYEICRKHDIPFETVAMTFESLDAAKLWACQHQEHRRNLTPFQRGEISLQFKPMIAAKAKERQVRKPVHSVPSTLTEQNEQATIVLQTIEVKQFHL